MTRDELRLWIGETVRIKRSGHCLDGRSGTLADVRRTRATIDYGLIGKWDIPIVQVTPPLQVEPCPGQLELF